jgi:TPR repeat protein
MALGFATAVGLALLSCATPTSSGAAGGASAQPEAERGCQEGRAAECGELGRALVDRVESDRAFEQGLVLLEAACGQGDPPACTTLGRTYLHRFRERSAWNRAADLLGRACGRGHAPACTGLGEALGKRAPSDRSPGPRRDAEEAFRRGCTMGDAEGCERYGRSLLGDEPGADRAGALEALARGCRLGRRSSCHLLGATRIERTDEREDGVSLLAGNCQRGYAPSCTVVARLFAPLVGAQPDCGRALSPAEAACAAGEAQGCVLADACKLASGQRGGALERLGNTCERGDALACLYWADAQDPGATSRDPRVRNAYAEACDRRIEGTTALCLRFALAELTGADTEAAAQRPLHLLGEACRQASGEACCRLAREHRAGRWVLPDVAEAAALAARACDLGCKECCPVGWAR